MDKKLVDYIESHNKKSDSELTYDFMPDVLEIIERPANKTGKIIIWSIFSFILFIILWASLSKIEIIASGQGKIISDEKIENLYSEDDYNIKKVNIKKGQKVNKDDVLFEFEIENFDAQKNTLESEVEKLQIQIDLYNDIIQKDSIENVNYSAYEDDEKIKTIINEYNEYKKIYQDYQSELAVETAENWKTQYIMTMQSYLSITQADYDKQKSDLDKLLENGKNIVKAPFDGIITEMYVDESQNSVSKGMNIASIVPEDTKFTMECYFNESDVIELKEGQKVNVKLNAYPYSDYGTIDGKISFISNVATANDELINTYSVEVEFDEDWQKKLKVGMKGSAEVVIGKRRIIEYVFEPIMGALNESFREK